MLTENKVLFIFTFFTEHRNAINKAFPVCQILFILLGKMRRNVYGSFKNRMRLLVIPGIPSRITQIYLHPYLFAFISLKLSEEIANAQN